MPWGQVFLPGIALTVLLAGCDPAIGPATKPAAPPQSDSAKGTATAPRSAASRALTMHYTRVENDLVGQGLLRRDGGGPDVPFTDRMLAENFVRIALFDEYVSQGGTLVAQQRQSSLRRWEQPVRVKLRFGDSVPEAQRSGDRSDVAKYVSRLNRVTGHPITLTEGAANFHVLVLNEDERRAAGPQIRSLMQGISPADIRLIEDLPKDIFCVVLANSAAGKRGYSRAVAVIRGEHPDLLRLSCLHEEIAQGLGLANDSPAARPSIFNDDEEFGLLTTHDELLLQILYDRRLKVGMTEAEARPIIRTIATELTDGTS
ncbi:DUF2927 domain-containing protein [Actibacterium sp. 188UL27-1]|uniref:DUF2927 domain-containing protein n=1 Tax=Actibacterium sp. 188UL27-1 TaxID=2786961 RepID=UPI001956792E|nr:DUF2927 domain-containing protein [Actibacterium sp. 188UL27-1]MBM7066655.1 DUF2927 domain-containing protein [Actibacterium sp. 188UL27-1]